MEATSLELNLGLFSTLQVLYCLLGTGACLCAVGGEEQVKFETQVGSDGIPPSIREL